MIKVSIGLEIFSLSILVLLFINLIIAEQTNRQDSMVMSFLIPDSMLYIANNLITLTCIGNPKFNLLVRILSVFSFIYGYLFAGTYLQFIVVYTENKKLIKLIPKISISLGVVAVIPVFISFFTGWYFTVENGTFIQQPLCIYNYLYILIIYTILAIICFTQNKVPVSAKLTSVLNIIIHISAVIAQTVYPSLKLTYPVTCIVVLMAYMMIYTKRGHLLQEAQEDLSKAQVSMTLSKIQPHFLFNSLTSISQLCLTDSEEAHTAIVEFAKYLRMNMDCLGNNTVVDFETELSHTKTYLKLEKLRYEDRLNIIYDITCDAFKIPSLTLQPIVENAVRHGISKLDEGGTIKISTHQIDNEYVIVVKDNGVGFLYDEQKSKKIHTLSDKVRSHIGLENVEARIQALCNGRMEIASSIGCGTTICLYIPII